MNDSQVLYIGLIVLIYLIHTLDSVLTYFGLKLTQNREINPLMNKLIQELGVGPALLFIQINFGIIALFPIYCTFYYIYNGWEQLFMEARIFLLVSLAVFRSVVIVWNVALLLGILPQPRPTPQKVYI